MTVTIRRFVFVSLLAFAGVSLSTPAFAQTTPGGHYDRGSLGLTTSLYTAIYPDFDADGNRNTIELIEQRPVPNGGGAVEIRVNQVAPTGPFRVCIGTFFTPTTVVWDHLGSDPAVWFHARIANLGGRYVIWYYTATTVGWLNIVIPSC